MSASYRQAKRLRGQSTDAERLVWNRLRNRQLLDCKFRRQQPIGPYIVDFCCMEKLLVVELDGGQHMLQQERDASRSAYLMERGYRVLRFWNNDVLAQIESVLGVIHEALAGPVTPHPSPLPQGERELPSAFDESE